MLIFLVMIVIGTATFDKGLGYPQPASQDHKIPSSEQHDDSDMYLEAEKSESRVDESGQASFYPSFPPYQNPPLGHSRPYSNQFQQERAYSHRPQSAYQQQITYDSPRFSGYKDDGFRAAANSESLGLLGSGNFGVIRGGTFYDNEGGETRNYDRDFSSYFGNSHGGPFYFNGGGGRGGGGVPNPKPYQHEQFENFRDFADINTPSNPAYSQFVVVYVNKNATKEDVGTKVPSNRPKNIIESLALLDLENTTENNVQPPPEKKLSRSKAKLAKLLPEKKYKQKRNETVRDLSEPLLALS